MNRGLSVALFACCLLACVGAVAATPSGSAFAQEDVDPDDVLMEIDVEDDGDATWAIEYRMRLETDEDEQAFEDLRDDIQADPEPYAERFQERMDGTAENAADATGREMAITEMAVSAEKRELPREYGVVTYTFRWSNFAAVEGDRLVVGDAIDGLFLDEDTALLVSWSDENELLAASPTPTDTRGSSVIYDGPINFGSGEPRIEIGPPDAAPPADSGGFLPVSPAIAVAAVVLLFGAGAGVFVAYRRRNEATAGDGTPAGEESSEDSAAGDDPTDAELLSNEEQVLRLIEGEGGRIKQKEVAERLEWTDAKTSQVTKKLREEGKLEGFRLGRENVLSLPEEGEE